MVFLLVKEMLNEEVMVVNGEVDLLLWETLHQEVVEDTQLFSVSNHL